MATLKNQDLMSPFVCSYKYNAIKLRVSRFLTLCKGAGCWGTSKGVSCLVMLLLVTDPIILL